MQVFLQEDSLLHPMISMSPSHWLPGSKQGSRTSGMGRIRKYFLGDGVWLFGFNCISHGFWGPSRCMLGRLTHRDNICATTVLQPKAPRYTPAVVPVGFNPCCRREKAHAKWEREGLRKRLSERLGTGFGLLLGDLGQSLWKRALL